MNIKNKYLYFHWINSNIKCELGFYPTPINFNYLYCSGLCLSFVMIFQCLSGVLISCYFIPIDMSFSVTNVDSNLQLPITK